MMSFSDADIVNSGVTILTWLEKVMLSWSMPNINNNVLIIVDAMRSASMLMISMHTPPTYQVDLKFGFKLHLIDVRLTGHMAGSSVELGDEV